eukprot:15790174-Heterocapsa_arctica.AAC.1
MMDGPTISTCLRRPPGRSSPADQRALSQVIGELFVRRAHAAQQGAMRHRRRHGVPRRPTPIQ